MGCIAKQIAERAKLASRALVAASTPSKNAALEAIAQGLAGAKQAILDANAKDMIVGKEANLSSSMLDRLMLDSKRIDGMAKAILAVRDLPDPVGEVTSTLLRPSGLVVQKVRAPLGVVLFVYESRPNVTTDAAALCFKSGNAVILRGGKEALQTNLAVGKVVAEGLKESGFPADAVQLVETPDRALLLDLLKQDELIDLAIPRGGEGLIRFVAENARVPVLKHYKGVCHVYIHKLADEKKALDIVVNAKVQRPGVCNAAECLLVDSEFLHKLAPIARALVENKVELRCCPRSLAALQAEGIASIAASEQDWGREFLDKIMAVKVVDGFEGAAEHIAKYGSLHTEAIVTQDISVASRFAREVVASAVMINASTRLNDGGELGLGAEIGISTTKLHAFGPMGMQELTTQRFIATGDGHVRT